MAGINNSNTSKLVNQYGLPIYANQDANGNYYSGASVIQNIVTSTNNSTTVNLTAGETFTGTADETFGVNGIQLFHAADQNCTIYLDQSIDNTFPAETTITDSFECLANYPCSRTFISVSPYYRLRVTNDGSSSTTSLACFTGMTPLINPLPRSLSVDGRLMSESTLVGRENTERHVWVNPTNELAVSPVYRMVGTNFDGTTLDPNFWTTGSLNDGTVTQSGGKIELKTNTTTPIASAKYTSVRKARFVAGSAMLFSGGVNFKTTYTADNIRRVGVYTTTAVANTPVDGFYFELNNATFSVNSRANGGTVSSIASGNFNGNYGVSWTPTADTYYKLAIEYIPLAVLFYINGKLLHKKVGAQQSYFMTLPITIENINTAGSVNVSFETVGMYIAREGELHTNPTSKYLLTGTSVLKYGAGVLKRIIVSDNIGGVIIYDNTAASGTIITSLDTSQGSEALGQVDFDLPFNNGLTIAITGDVGVTIIYE